MKGGKARPTWGSIGKQITAASRMANGRRSGQRRRFSLKGKEERSFSGQAVLELRHGSVHFQGRRRLGKWVLYPPSLKATPQLLRVLTDMWKLQAPSALVSVVGTYSKGEFTEQQEHVFSRGLRQLLTTTNGWIVTNGGEDGVAELIGAVMSHSSITNPCIAVQPWQIMPVQSSMRSSGRSCASASSSAGDPYSRRDSHSLDLDRVPSIRRTVSHRNAVDSSWHAARTGNLQEVTYVKEAGETVRKKETRVGQHRMHPTHTHFVLASEPPQKKSSATGSRWCERDVRHSIEMAICTTDIAGDGLLIPMLTLFLGGDLAALELAHARLKQGMLILVLPDSGGASADLHHWLRDETLTSDSPARQLRKEDRERYELLIADMLEYSEAGSSLEKPRLIFLVLDTDDIEINYRVDSEFMQAMLAVCNDVDEQIMLAVVWGDANILEAVLERLESQNRKAISHALQLALLRGHARMVEMLVNFNATPRYFDLTRFFTHDRNLLRLKGASADSWIGVHTNGSNACLSSQAGTSSPSKGWREQSSQETEDKTRKGSVRMSVDTIAEAEPQLPASPGVGGRNGTVKRSRKTRRSSSAQSGAGPWIILADHVEPYRCHIDARRSIDALAPNWTDLMLWAVLTGEEALATILWRRSPEPLRAAVMASQLYRKLSGLAHLRADQARLRKQSDALEDLALGVLDALSDPAFAIPVIAMVPCANAGTPLWAHSVLDVAAGHDVTYEISCKRFLAHRHSQNLLEAFFVGDFATSKARIPTDKSLIMIVLQAFFFFLPGTFCEVMPISSLLKEQTTANADYNSRVDRDVESGEEFSEESDFEGQPSLLREASRDLSERYESSDTLSMFFRDVVEDLRSRRWLYFFLVPKVKFVMYLTCHILNVMLLALVVFAPTDDIHSDGGGLDKVSILEVCYWSWAYCFFFAELKEFQNYRLEGLRRYLSSSWNRIDVLTLLLVQSVASLRLSCWDEAEFSPTVSDACAERLLWSRNIYSLLLVLLALKTLSYLKYFESIGVYIIILGEVARRDVSVFALLISFVSTGVGAAFALMLVEYDSTGIASHPGLFPFWSLVGFFNGIDLPNQVGTEQPTSVLMPCILFAYLVAGVVMVNLLIAAMAETYQRVKESSMLYWLFERAQLIQEFKRKGALPPPLNAVTLGLHDFPRVMRRIARLALNKEGRTESKRADHEVHDGFAILPGPTQLRQLQRKLHAAHRKCVTDQIRSKRTTVDFQLAGLADQQEQMALEQRTAAELLQQLAIEHRTGLEHLVSVLQQIHGIKHAESKPWNKDTFQGDVDLLRSLSVDEAQRDRGRGAIHKKEVAARPSIGCSTPTPGLKSNPATPPGTPTQGRGLFGRKRPVAGLSELSLRNDLSA